MARPKKAKLAEVLEVEEVEMYNGKNVIAKGEVEINGKLVKTITTEEGSTYII